MKTLSNKLPAYARQLFQPGGILLAAWLLLIGVLEFAGRSIKSDVGDVGVLLLLAMAAAVSAAVHAKYRAGWIDQLRRGCFRIWVRLQSWRMEVGVDFRKSPSLPRGMPNLWSNGILTAALVLVGLMLLRDIFPGSIRAYLAAGSYTVYLVVLALVWVGMFAMAAFMLLLPVTLIHNELVSRHIGQQPRSVRDEFVAQSLFLVILLVAGVFLPAWFPALGLVAALFLVLGIQMFRLIPSLVLTWKKSAMSRMVLGEDQASDDSIRVMEYRDWISAQLLAVGLIACSLIVITRGSLLFSTTAGGAADGMVVTPLFGLFFSWCVLAGFGAVLYLLWRLIWMGRFANPSHPVRPVLFVDGDLDGDSQRQVRRELRAEGWDVRFSPTRPDPLDVKIRVSPGTEQHVDIEGPSWPMEVPFCRLTAADNLWRYERRDEIQKRRVLVNGFKTLFKRAARRVFKQGQGYWLGPQHWFIVGMSRDVPEDELHDDDSLFDEIIGTPYFRLFPREARNHFLKMMNALELDIIFVGDGVSFRHFRKVLSCLFEVYDMHGGKQRAEERHFVGIPKTRVVILELEPEGRDEERAYQEPDYDQIGRARILEIFRDRPDHEEVSDTPMEDTDVPVLSGV